MLSQSKIHPTLMEQLETHKAAHATRPLRVIVLLRRGESELSSALKGAYDIRRTFRLIPAVALSASPQQVEALADIPAVELVWYDEPVHAMLDSSVALIGIRQMWQEGITGKGIRIGLIDTGIDPKHPDLRGRVAQMKDFTQEGPADNHGHGTHVAGIIGGSGKTYRGVAPDCFFYSAKVLREDGSGSMRDVMAGVEWATVQRVQLINLSLGGDIPSDGSDALSAMCIAAVSHGAIVCVAAGNNGPGAGTVGSPAAARAVITVGATSKADLLWDSSSRGPTSDRRLKPDICGPGVDIVSCRARGTSMGSPVDDFYTMASGTSMAAAHATGACALILQANPEFTPHQVKATLISKTKQLYREPNAEGKGRIDLSASSTEGYPAPSDPPEQEAVHAEPETLVESPQKRRSWHDMILSVIEGR